MEKLASDRHRTVGRGTNCPSRRCFLCSSTFTSQDARIAKAGEARYQFKKYSHSADNLWCDVNFPLRFPALWKRFTPYLKLGSKLICVASYFRV